MKTLEQAARQALGALEQMVAKAQKQDWQSNYPTELKRAKKTVTALREALAEQAEQEPVAQQDSDDKRLLREIFMLCEATEELEPTNDFMRGRIFEAKGIRRGIGNWYQDTFCGRSYMGEPVLNAAPVQQAEQEPVATAVVTKTNTNANYIINIDLSLTEAGRKLPSGEHKLYAAPVRTKDLTEAEIDDIWEKHSGGNLGFAYAVIAADRRKNK